MRNGVLLKLRGMRRWFAQAVMLAFVVPVLINLLPQPALSASAALDRDVMLSVCGQDMQQQQGGHQQHPTSHDHCVLCGSQCPLCSPSLASPAPAFATRPQPAGIPQSAAADALAAPLQSLLDASPPRGPPAVV